MKRYYCIAVLIIFSILLVLLSIQNYHLKNIVNDYFNNDDNLYQDSFLFSYKLKNMFLFKQFPIEINLNSLYFNKETLQNKSSNFLIMLSNLQVCGHCMEEELILLKQYRDILKFNNIQILLFFGVSNSFDDSYLLQKIKEDKLFFPIHKIKTSDMINQFGISNPSLFNTPFYIFLDANYKIIDIFKPAYMKTRELSLWLSLLTREGGLKYDS